MAGGRAVEVESCGWRMDADGMLNDGEWRSMNGGK